MILNVTHKLIGIAVLIIAEPTKLSIKKYNKINDHYSLFVYSKDNQKLFQCVRNVKKVIARAFGNVSVNDLLRAKTVIFDQKT